MRRLRRRYKIFGWRTGLRVSELGLGTGNFGSGWSHGTDREEAKRIFDGSVEAGGERELLDFPATPVAEVLSL